jgi:hypothetical protein
MHYKCLFSFSLSFPLLLVTHVGFQLNDYYPKYIVEWNSLDYKLPELPRINVDEQSFDPQTV